MAWRNISVPDHLQQPSVNRQTASSKTAAGIAQILQDRASGLTPDYLFILAGMIGFASIVDMIRHVVSGAFVCGSEREGRRCR
jgi:hypothetical protein